VRLSIGAVLLPPAAAAAAVAINEEPASWLSLSAATLRPLTADALLNTFAMILVAAPLAGVAAIGSEERDTRVLGRASAFSVVVTLAAAVLSLTASSALLTTLGRGDAGAIELVTASHLTLAAVAMALGVFGALCGAVLRDPLDGAAIAVGLVLVAAGGVILAGAPVADLPRELLRVGLVASPLVAMASAAGIDVIRLDTVYQISPLAHMGIDYPSWVAACGSYLATSFVFFIGLVWRCRPRVEPAVT
jgi:hypothetical protein